MKKGIKLLCPRCQEESVIKNNFAFKQFNKFLSGSLQDNLVFSCSNCGKPSNANNWFDANTGKLKRISKSTNIEMAQCIVCSNEILKTTYKSNLGLCNSCSDKKKKYLAETEKSTRSKFAISGATVGFIIT